MKRSKIVAGVATLIPAAGLFLMIQTAGAHFPDIAASAACADATSGNAKVVITVTSWQTDLAAGHRQDNDIAVSWDGAVVQHGVFTPENGYSFKVTLTPVADGTTHTATATAIAAFGPNGEFGFAGELRTVSVVLPKDCVPPPATTTAAPTTTAKAQVLGTTVTKTDVATPVAVLPKFAG